MPYTVVSFHAHPDDEALLTAGTLARAVAEGHRVVLVTATDGSAGLTSTAMASQGNLGAIRLRELQVAAEALGVHRVVSLGYPDGAFSTIDVGAAAEALADVLREESADVLTTYDRAGGYGHPDHVHVHRVGAVAARRAGTPVILEATVDRRLLLRAVRAMRLLPRSLRIAPDQLRQSYTSHEEITHRVDVRGHVGQKQSALAAHHSQQVGGPGRTVAYLVGLPPLLARYVLGREWFVEPGRPPTARPCDDIFASLR